VVKALDLDKTINRHVNLLKIYMPYSESDHLLNIAYNLLARGNVFGALGITTEQQVYLNALAAQRIPDPTTANLEEGTGSSSLSTPSKAFDSGLSTTNAWQRC